MPGFTSWTMKSRSGNSYQDIGFSSYLAKIYVNIGLKSAFWPTFARKIDIWPLPPPISTTVFLARLLHGKRSRSSARSLFTDYWMLVMRDSQCYCLGKWYTFGKTSHSSSKTCTPFRVCCVPRIRGYPEFSVESTMFRRRFEGCAFNRRGSEWSGFEHFIRPMFG